tara:strand:+ start:1347 stop:2132 length:786 start_codon:yes stop_codon:yes gene_type:complete
MNNFNNKIWIALPVYNEWPAIKSLIENLLNLLDKEFRNYEIVICNDGSNDKSEIYFKELVNNKNITLIEHDFNRGLAESIRDIFEYVSFNSKNDDVLIRMDGDATHNPIYIIDMINKINDGYDVVVAARTKSNDKNLPYSRRLFSLIARYFIKIFYRLPKLIEYTGGFRAYKMSILHKAFNFYKGNFIQLGSFGFVCTFEKLVKLSLIKAKFGEVPFTLQYENKTGKSKMVPWITILGYIILIPIIYFPKTGWKSRAKGFN